jgi:hypothetical protein
MMIDFRDRVNKLLKTATKVFGEEIILMPKKGGQYKIKGIFDNEYQAIDPDTEEIISSNQPVLGVNLHELKIEPQNGDLIRIRNLIYKIIDVREDGQGGASLFLHREKHGEKVRKKKDQA